MSIKQLKFYCEEKGKYGVTLTWSSGSSLFKKVNISASLYVERKKPMEGK